MGFSSCPVCHSFIVLLPLCCPLLSFHRPVLWLRPLPVEPPPGKAGSGSAAGQGAAAGREPGPVPRGGQALAVRLQPATHRRPLNYVSVLHHILLVFSPSPPNPILLLMPHTCTAPAHTHRQVSLVTGFPLFERLISPELFQTGSVSFSDRTLSFYCSYL